MLKVIDIKEKLRQSKKFWSNLPEELCVEDRVTAGNASDDECWNGHTKGRYVVPPVTKAGQSLFNTTRFIRLIPRRPDYLVYFLLLKKTQEVDISSLLFIDLTNRM